MTEHAARKRLLPATCRAKRYASPSIKPGFYRNTGPPCQVARFNSDLATNAFTINVDDCLRTYRDQFVDRHVGRGRCDLDMCSAGIL